MLVFGVILSAKNIYTSEKWAKAKEKAKQFWIPQRRQTLMHYIEIVW